MAEHTGFHRMRYGRTALILTVCCFASAAAQAEPLRLLFFGNSFTQGGGTSNVAATVGWIATSAGHETPQVVHDLSGLCHDQSQSPGIHRQAI